MASNQDDKKIRDVVSAHSNQKPMEAKRPRRIVTISSVVPVQEISYAEWDPDCDDVLAGAIRSFFQSHTLDLLTGEVHTLH